MPEITKRTFILRRRNKRIVLKGLKPGGDVTAVSIDGVPLAKTETRTHLVDVTTKRTEQRTHQVWGVENGELWRGETSAHGVWPMNTPISVTGDWDSEAIAEEAEGKASNARDDHVATVVQ